MPSRRPVGQLIRRAASCASPFGTRGPRGLHRSQGRDDTAL